MHKVELLAVTTGYKQVSQFALPAETVHHIWLPLRLSGISCFLLRLLCLVNSFLQRLSVWFSFLPRLSAGSRITRTVSAGSHFSWRVVSAGSKRSRTVSAEAKYDRQSLQEVKISGLVYTPWWLFSGKTVTAVTRKWNIGGWYSVHVWYGGTSAVLDPYNNVGDWYHGNQYRTE